MFAGLPALTPPHVQAHGTFGTRGTETVDAGELSDEVLHVGNAPILDFADAERRDRYGYVLTGFGALLCRNDDFLQTLREGSGCESECHHERRRA